jgi:hypothetical protein
MGVLANHVPSIEQLKPGLIEVIEESGGSKQFFCTSLADQWVEHWREVLTLLRQCLAALRLSNPTPR